MTTQPSPTDRAAWSEWRRDNPGVPPDLSGANLSGANLSGANLRRADLCDANLRRADLCDANLRRADLCGANLSGANLCGADLSDADLRDADLCRADLCRADLSGADLCGANLRGADLSGANLRGANLRGANLRGADLSGANLRGARLNWNSHDLISAILARAAGEDYARRALAGSILVSRDWCWREWIALPLWEQRPDLLAWARERLAPYVRRDDMTAQVYAFLTDGQEVQS